MLWTNCNNFCPYNTPTQDTNYLQPFSQTHAAMPGLHVLQFKKISLDHHWIHCSSTLPIPIWKLNWEPTVFSRRLESDQMVGPSRYLSAISIRFSGGRSEDCTTAMKQWDVGVFWVIPRLSLSSALTLALLLPSLISSPDLGAWPDPIVGPSMLPSFGRIGYHHHHHDLRFLV